MFWHSFHYRKRELSYGEKDLLHTYTLCVDDVVQFNIATDKRDHMQRATNLTLANNFFDDNKTSRETVSPSSASNGPCWFSTEQ